MLSKPNRLMYIESLGSRYEVSKEVVVVVVEEEETCDITASFKKSMLGFPVVGSGRCPAAALA